MIATVGGGLREGIARRYRAIQAHDRRDPTRRMGRALAVSAAGSDAWRAWPESPRSIHSHIRGSAIRVIHQESREPDGSLSIWDAWLTQGHRIGAHRVARLMHQARLRHHSDSGSQYAATSDQHGLDADSLIPSMSRTGNGWDNACVEHCFGALTRELVPHRRDATWEEATPNSFDYMEVFDNRTRRHSTLGDDSPSEYDARTAVA